MEKNKVFHIVVKGGGSKCQTRENFPKIPTTGWRTNREVNF
jgi:hypothetical protein